MTRRTSCPDSCRWSELLDGQLPAREHAELSGHLEVCPGCQEKLEWLTAMDVSWCDPARSLEQPRPSSPRLRRVIEDLKSEAGNTTGPHLSVESSVPDLPFLRPLEGPDRIGRLGPYEVIEVIGQGGMGTVLKAFDPALQRLVAVKVLALQWATSAAARQRFEREGRAMAAVHHDHVVAVHGVEQFEGLPYLVMEYVPGESLQQHLDRAGTLELEEVLSIGMQTASGLAAAHEQGLIHRDVKPANILLQGERVKLTDFGLARAVDDASLTHSGVIAGTPYYMSPEQARGTSLDPRTDLFSLGSVLYTLCTGRPPFSGSTVLAVLRSVCEDTPQTIQELNPAIPDWFVEIIDTLLAKEPTDRFLSAEELARLLRQHLRHLRSPDQVRRPDRLSRRRPRRPGRRRLLLVLACFALGLLGAFACWFAFGPRTGRDPGIAQEGGDRAAIGQAFDLTNGRVLRMGLQDSVQVDYRRTQTDLPADARCVWVVQSPQGLLWEDRFLPAQRGQQGTLQARIGAGGFNPGRPLGRGNLEPRLNLGPVETYLAMDVGGQRVRISNTLFLNRWP